MKNAHKFWLPSGVECEIRQATMMDREVFSNPKYVEDLSGLPRYLASVIARVGNRTEIGYKLSVKTDTNFDVLDLIDVDIKYILVNSHVFDSDMEMEYEFDYIFDGFRKKKGGEIVSTKLQKTIIVDLSDIFETSIPCMIPIYKEGVLEKWQVFAPEEASEDAAWAVGLEDFECVTFDDYYTMLETINKTTFYDTKGNGYSITPITTKLGLKELEKAKKQSNDKENKEEAKFLLQITELKARKLSRVHFQENEGVVEQVHTVVNLDNADEIPKNKDFKAIQSIIRKMQGCVDMIVEFDNQAFVAEKYDMKKPKTHPTYKEHLLSFPDFLYRTAIH